MARKGTTSESRLWYVPTIASGTGAPTVAEVTAGTDLTPWLTRDGFDAPSSTSQIDSSDAASRNDKSVPGNIAASNVTLKFYRDSVPGDDDVYALLDPDLAGYLVVRDFGGSGVGNLGTVEAFNEPWAGRPASATLTLPPLAGLWLRLRR